MPEHISGRDITAAAKRVATQRLRHGVSTAYVDSVLIDDPAWTDAPMRDLKAVQARVTQMFTDYLAALDQHPACTPRSEAAMLERGA